MTQLRRCLGTQVDGRPCDAAPRRSSRLCFFHDPETAAEAAEARRLGGQRRRREATLAGAFDVSGIRTMEDIFRVVEVAMFEALRLDNSVARARVLLHAARVALEARQVAEFDARLEALEARLRLKPLPTQGDLRRADEW